MFKIQKYDTFHTSYNIYHMHQVNKFHWVWVFLDVVVVPSFDPSN
jgi:hypothetical protein